MGEPDLCVEEVAACALPAWYSSFKPVTFASRVLDLPPEFVAYLRDSGPLYLPNSADPSRATFRQTDRAAFDADDDGEWDEANHEGPADKARLPSFPELEASIERAIAELGGAVLPKLNWSAPRDACWITPTNSLKCTAAGDVFLLLKSSDFVSHDLTMAFEGCADEAAARLALERTPFKLVLRNWRDLSPAGEFRCFVSAGKLAGVSQRDTNYFHKSIADSADAVLQDVCHFFDEQIRRQFPLDNYVFDVYRERPGKLLLVDFNPFCATTDSLLFSWDELRGAAGPAPARPEDESVADMISSERGAATSGRGEEEEEEEEEETDEETDEEVEFEADTEEEEDTAEEEEEEDGGGERPGASTRQITQTDHLNKKLLEAFMGKDNFPAAARGSSSEGGDDDEDEWATDDGEGSGSEVEAEAEVERGAEAGSGIAQVSTGLVTEAVPGMLAGEDLTQTDHLNRSLMRSFMAHMTAPGSGVPTVEGVVYEDSGDEAEVVVEAEESQAVERAGAGLAATLAQEDLTQTDHLNRSLMRSFMAHMTAPGSGVPTVDGVVYEDSDGSTDDAADPVDTRAAAAGAGGVPPPTNPQDVELRFVEAATAIRPSAYLTSGLPRDFLDMATPTDDLDTLLRMYKEGKLDPHPDGEDEEGEGEEADC